MFIVIILSLESFITIIITLTAHAIVYVYFSIILLIEGKI